MDYSIHAMKLGESIGRRSARQVEIPAGQGRIKRRVPWRYASLLGSDRKVSGCKQPVRVGKYTYICIFFSAADDTTANGRKGDNDVVDDRNVYNENTHPQR